jgi:hypothetical protein
MKMSVKGRDMNGLEAELLHMSMLGDGPLAIHYFILNHLKLPQTFEDSRCNSPLFLGL